MTSPLQQNGRVESQNGMRFYEQDVIMLSYLYTEDVTIDFEVEYAMPGFGIVLSAYNKWDGKPKTETRTLLAKLGHMEMSAYERNLGQQKRIHQESNTLQPDKKLHKFRFVKSGNRLHVFEVNGKDEDLLGESVINDAYDRFYLGVYSNEGNTIQSMKINDNRPSVWNTNIENADGGRVSFHQDGFTVENAEDTIEVVREDIPLAAGRYFFTYKTSAVNGVPFNGHAYVFPSREPKIKAPEKNLLRLDEKHYGSTSYFDVAEDTHVTILFQMRSGSVDDVSIKSDPAQEFVSTNDKTSERGGSSLQLNLKNLQSVQWKGVIYGVPHAAIDEKPKYALLAYGNRSVDLDSGSVNRNVTYDYELKLSGGVWIFRILLDGKEIHYSAYVAGEPVATIFSNVSGKIEKITIVDKDGKSREIMYQRTIKKFVPASIQSPVIVTGKDEVPFDLSASYRRLPDGRYFFTNWEREIFKVNRSLTLEKPLYGSTDIVLYGIKSEYDLSKLYDVSREEFVSHIEGVADQYDEITNDFYEIKKDQVLVLSDSLDRSKYCLFIVDYLKNDSYAINKSENGEYELDISTEREDVNTYYDVSSSGEIRSYKLLDLPSPKDNDFIVLRRNEVIS